MLVTQSRVASGLLAAWLLIAATPAPAQQLIPGYGEIEDYDPREVAMLPRYCLYTQLFRDHLGTGTDSAEVQRWYSVMGPTFHAMHHYCWGLMKTNRALFLARNTQVRNFYLNSSVGEFDYVLQRAPRDFALLPEILTKKGENLLKLGNVPMALAILEEAATLKPDYWPPYAALSDHFKNSGDISRAKEWLEKGLQADPESRALRTRRQDLDKRRTAAP